MGAVTWYYGSGQSPKWFQRIDVKDRLYQQVERQYRVAVYEEVFNDTVLALRAGGTGGSGGPVGTPIFVVHVDNSAPGGGDGTVEHPLNYLPTTTPGNVDIVFVRRGTGTSTNYNNGITLNNYQRLLGDGVHHNFTSLAGTFPLPGYTPGALPTITNPAGNVVTLASYNEVSGFNINNAGGSGIYGNTITDFNINNVNITNSANSGIDLVNVSGSGQIFDSTMTGNDLQGINIDNFGTALALSVNNVTATGNLTGIAINGQAGATFAVSMNTVDTSDNNHDGIAISLLSGSSFAGTFFNITSNNNNIPQDDLGFGNGFSATVDASVAAFDIENSTLNGNNLNGVSVVATNGSSVALSLINNDSTISNNLLNGVFVDGTDSALAVLLQNNVISNNGNLGVNLQATDGSLDLIAINNTLNANHGAGIGYTLRDTATGTFDIRGNTITGTLDDANASTVYSGQAIFIRLDGSTDTSAATATVTSGIIDHNLIGSLTNAAAGNVGGGIFISTDQNTTLSNVTIGNTDGANSNGNVIANNGGDGINFNRTGNSVINNVVIQDNVIRQNTGDGIEIDNFGSAVDVADFTIQDNLIRNNTSRGIAFVIQADAQTSANMFNNLITLNGSHGIQLTESANSPLDLRFLTGTWQRNDITSNTGSGVQLDGVVSNLLIGSTASGTDGNNISKNTLWGIDLTNSGSLTIGFNEIFENTAGGVGLHTGTTNYDNATNTVATISRNFIHDNGGDGIEILSQGAGNAQLGSFASGTVTATIQLNTISFNAGRGIDILNRAGLRYTTSPLANVISPIGTITIDQNLIANNKLEAVYVVNTSADSQNQTNPVGSPMALSPFTTIRPRLFFTMTDNTVIGNGSASAWTATGLVLRVGTSDGGFDYTYDGGFFGEGRGGVGATVTGNTFHGNQGDDVYFDSFVSTVDPDASAGTWSETEFTVTRFDSDPLARLDLTFLSNTFDSADVNNAGPPNTDAGAFYDNAEGTFKSRVVSADITTGPFANADRSRNAQRLAARFTLPPSVPTPPPPNGGFDSGDFLYSGMGQSTFRLLNAGTPGNIGVFNPAGNVGSYANGGFLIDNFYTNIFDARGVFNTLALEEMPWGWNVNGGNPRPQ